MTHPDYRELEGKTGLWYLAIGIWPDQKTELVSWQLAVETSSEKLKSGKKPAVALAPAASGKQPAVGIQKSARTKAPLLELPSMIRLLG
jgi:hypothetical protein